MRLTRYRPRWESDTPLGPCKGRGCTEQAYNQCAECHDVTCDNCGHVERAGYEPVDDQWACDACCGCPKGWNR